MEGVRKPTYEELEKRVAEQEQRIVELKAQIDKLTKMLFGKKSEKSKKEKEKQQPSNESSDEPKPKRKNNGGGGRKPFHPGIPRRDVRIDLPEDECRCGFCGKEFESMGVEITEILHYVPMILVVLRYIRERRKATCTCRGTKIIIAEMPIRTIDKGMVTTEFIAAVLMNKYCDHMPIHRQVSRLFKSCKVDISESSVCRWRDQVADQLKLLYDFMKSRIKQSYCINTVRLKYVT